MAAALVLLIGLDVLARARARARSQLQDLAEHAASAGVKALHDSVGQSETQRRETAVAATRAVTHKVGSARVTVTTSVTPIYVSVELSETPGWFRRINGRLDVVGKAGYLPPAQSTDEQQRVSTTGSIGRSCPHVRRRGPAAIRTSLEIAFLQSPYRLLTLE
jgi:hypothetical protein